MTKVEYKVSVVDQLSLQLSHIHDKRSNINSFNYVAQKLIAEGLSIFINTKLGCANTLVGHTQTVCHNSGPSF